MRDLFLSIRGVLYERLAGPFYGSFILAWIGVNYPLVIALFFDSSKDLGMSKVKYFQQYQSCYGYEYLLGWPLLVTVVLIIGGGGIAVLAFGVQQWLLKQKEIIRNYFQKTRILTDQESREILGMVDRANEETQKMFRDKNNEIEKLKKSLIECQKQNEGLTSNQREWEKKEGSYKRDLDEVRKERDDAQKRASPFADEDGIRQSLKGIVDRIEKLIQPAIGYREALDKVLSPAKRQSLKTHLDKWVKAGMDLGKLKIG